MWKLANSLTEVHSEGKQTGKTLSFQIMEEQ